MNRLHRVLAVAVVLVVILPAPVPVDAAEVGGRIVDFDLLAPADSITVGDTITWTNEGKRPHTVTDRGGQFGTDPILPGAKATTEFDTPGTYELFCEINPSRMNATVVVLPGDAAPTQVRIQAFDELREGETKRFDPARLEVASGTRLILANVGGLRHSLKAETGDVAIPVVEPGAENGRFAGANGSVVVEEPGTYPFFCEIHPQAMKGTLVVTDDRVDAQDLPPPEPEEPDPDAEVGITDFAFEETNLTVARSARVTWMNTGSAPHTATFDDVPLDTGRLTAGKTATLTAPEQPGTYSYYCAVHPDLMRAALTVVPAAVAAGAGGDGAAGDGSRGGDTQGTVFAYTLAAMLVAVGAFGLVAGLRSR